MASFDVLLFYFSVIFSFNYSLFCFHEKYLLEKWGDFCCELTLRIFLNEGDWETGLSSRKKENVTVSPFFLSPLLRLFIEGREKLDEILTVYLSCLQRCWSWCIWDWIFFQISSFLMLFITFLIRKYKHFYVNKSSLQIETKQICCWNSEPDVTSTQTSVFQNIQLDIFQGKMKRAFSPDCFSDILSRKQSQDLLRDITCCLILSVNTNQICVWCAFEIFKWKWNWLHSFE